MNSLYFIGEKDATYDEDLQTQWSVSNQSYVNVWMSVIAHRDIQNDIQKFVHVQTSLEGCFHFCNILYIQCLLIKLVKWICKNEIAWPKLTFEICIKLNYAQIIKTKRPKSIIQHKVAISSRKHFIFYDKILQHLL